MPSVSVTIAMEFRCIHAFQRAKNRQTNTPAPVEQVADATHYETTTATRATTECHDI